MVSRGLSNKNTQLADKYRINRHLKKPINHRFTQMDTDEREMNDDSPFYEGGWGDLGLIQTVYTRSQRRRGRDVYSFACVP